MAPTFSVGAAVIDWLSKQHKWQYIHLHTYRYPIYKVHIGFVHNIGLVITHLTHTLNIQQALGYWPTLSIFKAKHICLQIKDHPNGNSGEQDQKSIMPGVFYDECTHQVWGQSHKQCSQKCGNYPTAQKPGNNGNSMPGKSYNQCIYV